MLNYKEIIYVKYSELTLKGKNRNYFIQCLVSNIKHAFKGKKFTLKYFYDYLLIEDFEVNDKQFFSYLLSNIPGIHAFTYAKEISKDLDLLVSLVSADALEQSKNDTYKTFRLTCYRQDKTFISSNEVIALIAKNILQNTSLTVNLKKYDINWEINIKKDKIIVFNCYEKGMDGLPIGSNGRSLVLLSGGIDSPVASRLMMNRGIRVDFITFITPPHTTQQALEKVRTLVKKITLNGMLQNAKLFICNFTPVMHEITHIKKTSYRITLMRRQFFNIAKKVAINNKIKVIVTGESLGQVASQTIESMETISEVLDNFLILRPLICMNKEQIIQIAKNINTYETSILPYDDSCSLFAPKNPVTKPNIQIAKELENSCYMLKEIVKKTIDNTLESKEEIKYE